MSHFLNVLHQTSVKMKLLVAQVIKGLLGEGIDVSHRVVIMKLFLRWSAV